MRLLQTLAFLLVVVTILGSCRSDSPGGPGGVNLRPGKSELAIEFEGRRRTAVVFIPTLAPAPEEGWPMVLMLHGAGGSTRSVIEATGWADLGERDGFVTVFPNGTPSYEGRKESFLRNPQSWNSGEHSSFAARARSAIAKKINDVGFLTALIDTLGRRTSIDPRRIYVAGHSNGASMAYRFGFERSSLVAAVGAVAGHFMATEGRLTSPVSLIQIVGDQDPYTPLGGGEAGVGRHKMVVAPALEAPTRWARLMGLGSVPRIIRDDEKLKEYQWGPSEQDEEVRTLIVKGQGHNYPRRSVAHVSSIVMGPSVNSLSATETIWEFFKAHPKPPEQVGSD
ncbi:MAG TPA: PHB depolymerase family esterase [Bacteroidota bacterium]|nr:PHB depolymerase family esterase [Bacteroidota bacterium]